MFLKKKTNPSSLFSCVNRGIVLLLLWLELQCGRVVYLYLKARHCHVTQSFLICASEVLLWGSLMKCTPAGSVAAVAQALFLRHV